MSIRAQTGIRSYLNYVCFRAPFAAHVQLAPAFLCFVLLFATPMLLLFWVSLWRHDPNSFGPTAVTIENYTRFLLDPFYLKALWRTLFLGIVTTLITIVIAYPLAMLMTRVSAGVRSALILLILFPLMISVVVRVFGWMVILGDNGIVNSALEWLGLIDSPLHMMESMTAVIVGLVQVWMAFAVLPIYSALMSIGSQLEEASATLGASPWRTFRHVVLPLSMPGVAAGMSLVFSLTVASFVQPQLLGGTGYFVMTTLIYQQVSVTLNWPFAAAIGLILLVVAVVALVAMNILVKKLTPKGAHQ